MKIIEAVWEKRNIGYDTYEIILDKKDFADPKKIMDELSNPAFDNCYVVVKMPVGNLEILHMLEDFGFRFMETQLKVSRDISEYKSPVELVMHNEELIRYEVPKKEEKWEKILGLMTEDMYSTDRIYLDPILPMGCSLFRYKNWMMDLLKNDQAHMFVTEYKNEILAFGVDVLDFEKRKVIGLLGGILEKFQNQGLGFIVWNKVIQHYSFMGIKTYITSISSNNLSVVKLYQFFDFKISSLNYVLRKIKEK